MKKGDEIEICRPNNSSRLLENAKAIQQQSLPTVSMARSEACATILEDIVLQMQTIMEGDTVVVAGEVSEAAAAQRLQMTKTRQNKFTRCDFTNFSKSISADSLDFRFRSLQVLYFQNVSKCCIHM